MLAFSKGVSGLIFSASVDSRYGAGHAMLSNGHLKHHGLDVVLHASRYISRYAENCIKRRCNDRWRVLVPRCLQPLQRHPWPGE